MHGDGERLTLFLLPGLDGTGQLYLPFIAAAHPGFDVDCCEYPSSPFYDYDELVQYVERRLPGQEPYALVAESFAGPLALIIAATQPKNLRALVLAASFSDKPVPNAKQLATLLRFLPAVLPPRRLLHFWLTGNRLEPGLAELLDTALAGIPAITLKRRAIAALQVDVRPLLSRIAVPVLYLRGKQDRLIGAGKGKQLTDACRFGEIVDVDAPHFLFQTVPEAAAAEIRYFLERRIGYSGS